MTATTRQRRHTGIPLLRYGFRPFFLGAGLWAVFAVAIRIVDVGLAPSDGFAFRDATRWHAHELIFGYGSAVVAGFALTAVPNWTGRLPITGRPLLALFGLWFAGRAALLSPLPATLAIGTDVAFLFVLAAVLAREIVAGRNVRNLPVCVLISCLGAANVAFHLETIDVLAADGYGQRAGIAILVLLIGVIGGRIVPSFTNNWFARQRRPRTATARPAIDRLSHAASGIALVLWIAFPYEQIVGLAFTVAAAIQLYRLAAWGGWRTWREPLVLVLHVGYAWIPAGFLLLAVGSSAAPAAMSAGLHALAVGAIGTMTLAVMTRATLGHTGRELRANRATVGLYAAITASAILRSIAPFVPDLNLPLLIAAGSFWVVAFGLFVAVYGPMHLTPRLGDPA